MTKKQHAFGRSLGDFRRLNKAEKKVIAAARDGEIACFGDNVPETTEEQEICTIQAGLIRFLALGGDDATPVHEHGVRVKGAFIKGALDLENCTLASHLVLEKCKLSETLSLRDARTRTVNLDGSSCGRIAADRVQVSGGLFMRDGFRAEDVVLLLGATITANFECKHALFNGRDANGYALLCDGVNVGGAVLLDNTTIKLGAVRFVGAAITVNLECEAAHFEGQDKLGNALICHGIQVGNSVYLREGFSAAGDTGFVGAMIGRDLSCTGGNFGYLNLARSTITGTLWLTGRSKAIFHGGVDLAGARIGRIMDAVKMNRESLPSIVDANENPTFLGLDGATYDRFGERTDVSAAARIKFLRLQHESDLCKKFKPQPWIQMVKVLRDSGDIEAAREVAIAYEIARAKAGVITNRTARALHWVYGVLVGYGHRPMRLFWIMVIVWFSCGVVYQIAATDGWMAPTQPGYFQNPHYKDCRPENGGNWVKCDRLAASEYTSFQSFAYSLDLILPVVGLQQEKDWAPIVDKGSANAATVNPCLNFGMFTRWVMWFEILFGWVASLLLAAVLSGLAKKME